MAMYGVGAPTRMPRGHRECVIVKRARARVAARRCVAEVTCELRHGRDFAVSPFSDAASIYYTPSEIERW